MALGGLAVLASSAAVASIAHAPALEAALRASAAARVRGDVARLGTLLDLRDEAGVPRGLTPLPLDVGIDAGPPWLGDVVEGALRADPCFAVGADPAAEGVGPPLRRPGAPASAAHGVLRVDVVGSSIDLGWRLGVVRRGTEVRVPEPTRVRMVPYVAWAGLAVAAWVLAARPFTRRASVRAHRLAVAGALMGLAAQVLLRLAPASPDLPAPKWADAWTTGPLATAVRTLAQGLGDAVAPFAYALLGLAVAVAVLDHRRTRGGAGDLGWRGAVALLGVGAPGFVAWCEAAWRSGALHWVATPLGAAFGFAALACLAAAAWATRAERPAPPRSVAPPSVPTSAAVLVAALTLCGGCRGDGGPAPTGTAAAAPAPSLQPRALAPVARVRGTDEWLNLIDQRPSAALLRDERLVVDLRSARARAFLALGSEALALPVHVADEPGPVAVVRGQGASFDLPLDGPLSPALHPPQDDKPGLALAITLRATMPDQSLTVLWEERPLANLRIDTTWQRRTISLPPDLLHPGDHRLRLHFRRTTPGGDAGATEATLAGSSALIQTIEVGPRAAIVAGPPADPQDGRPAYEVRPLAGGQVALSLASGASLAWYFDAPRRARLAIDAHGQGGVFVRVSTDADHARGVAPVELLRQPLIPTGRTLDVDLSGYGGLPVRVEVGVFGDGARGELRAAHVAAKRSVPRDLRSRDRSDVIAIAVEGLRADEVLDPLRRPALENFGRLMAEGLVFEHAYAVGAAAVPNHAAWLSSVAPPVHLTSRGTYVAAQQVALPEVLRRAGYRTLLASADAYVDESRGLTQGIDRVLHVPREAEERDGRAVMRRALEAWRDEPSPRALTLVLTDPQAPYDPPREAIEGVEPPEGAPRPHLTHIWAGRVRMGNEQPTAAVLSYVRRLYRGDLQTVDTALGELLAALEADGRLDDTIVAVFGVHGEEFLEHGSTGHGRTLHEESIHVPVIVRAPRVLAPGRVSTPVDLLDLPSTLLDLLGVPAPAPWQGESLVPVIDDPQPPPRLVLASLGDGSRAGRVGPHKLLVGAGRDQTYEWLPVGDAADDGPGASLAAVGRPAGLGADAAATARPVTPAGGIGLRIVRAAMAWQLHEEGEWRRLRWGTGAALTSAFALDHGM